MAFKPSPEQEKIINARNTSLLVSAAAGSGKTSVLVERIVSLVCDEKDPVDIDRILVVTFTKSAAAEMKERILKRINEKLEDDPDNEHLQRQITLVHQALITTIDSFCLDVIRNHYQETGIEPDFRVADEGEAHLIETDVLAKVLEDAYAKADPAFLKCVESFCPGNNDSMLEDLILDLSRISDSYPWPLDYLEERRRDHDTDPEKGIAGSPLEKEILMSCLGYAENALFIIETAISISEDHPILAAIGTTFSLDRDSFETVKEACISGSYRDLYELLNGDEVKKTRLKSTPKALAPEEDQIRETVGAQAKKLRDIAWKEIDKLKAKFFSFSIEDQINFISGCRESMNALIDLAVAFRNAFADEKKKRHVVDFPDLSHLSLDILADHRYRNGVLDIEPTAAAIEYRDKFVQVMTDEYQDSNLIQEVILSAVSAESIGRYNRFIVGDVKQSIYSFRRARPDLFIEKQREYRPAPPRMEIDLSGNYRSRREVIDSVNRVFERIMHKDTGNIEYDGSNALIPKADYPENEGCKTELIIYDNKLLEDTAAGMADAANAADDEGGEFVADALDFMEDASDKSEVEAVIVATKIREIMKSRKVTEGNGDEARLRDVRYSDIVILRRSTSSVTDTYRRVFASMGIPFYAEGKNGYFKTPEVSLMLQYLRVLVNPLDDVPFYAVLHSVFGGFDENEVGLIRSMYRNMPLYESFCKAVGRETAYVKPETEVEETGDFGEFGAELLEKVNAFLDRMDSYREMSSYMTVRQLLDRVISDHHYMEVCLALPGGQGREANVRMLLVMAASYERSSYLGINDFIRYIDNMEKFEVDSGEVGSSSESADVVRLMTIHKSKGLEFPMVILAGCGRGFNFKDLNSPVLADDDLGIACRYTDEKKRIRVRTLRHCAVSDKKRRDIIAEEMRLLYVAMTRAREKLILIGGLKKAEEELVDALQFPSQYLSFGSFQAAGSYLDLLMPVIGCEEVGEAMDIELLDPEYVRKIEKKDLEDAAAGVTEFTVTEGGDLRFADMEEYEKLKEKFSYVYPYGYFEKLYSKTTVSELKMAAMAERDEGAYDLMEHGEDETAVPVFAGGSVSRIYDGEEEHRKADGNGSAGKMFISGTERGNAYHRFMQLISWDRILGQFADALPDTYEEYAQMLNSSRNGIIASIKRFWDEEKAAGHISDKTHAAIDEGKIFTFLNSNLSWRMWKADRAGLLKREQPFVYGIPASRLLDPEHSGSGSSALDNEILMIQGIIDAYFVEDGNIILLDYKTDIISGMAELWNRYETQMDYYREALESLEGLGVTERYLYSFNLGEAGKR